MISLVGLLVCLVALFVGYYCCVAVVVLLLRSQVCINLELLSVLVACAWRVPGVLVRVGLIVGLYVGSGVWFAFPMPGMWARFYLVVACWFRCCSWWGMSCWLGYLGFGLLPLS